MGVGVDNACRAGDCWAAQGIPATQAKPRFPIDQLAEARENLRLIQERKSQYVMETDIPLCELQANQLSQVVEQTTEQAVFVR